MPGYICMMKWTQQGAANIKEAPQRFEQSKALAEKMGIRTVGTWVTMGEQDIVVVFDAPDDQTMSAFALAIASRGNGTTKTMRALSEEEFAQVVSKLP
jgi:uncharacterized protein with GYD domain